MRSVTVKELEALLESKRGASFVTIIANTAPDFVGGKSSPMHGVRKTAKVNGMINWSYRNAVDNQRAREEQPLNANGEVEWFEPEPRKWGERLHDEVGRLLPTVEHKGTKYLELKVQKSVGYMYFRNNLRVSNEEVNPHLRKKVEGRRQEVDNPVILRDYKLENIKAIRIDGELLVVQVSSLFVQGRVMGKSGKNFREHNKRQDRRQKADAKRRWLVDTNKQDRRAA